MNACGTDEALEQFLAGQLDGARARRLQEHLAGCNSCWVILEQLSEKPALRFLAAAYRWPPEAPVNDDLSALLKRWTALSALDTGATRSTNEASGSGLDFLAPPKREGDLGMLGEYHIVRELERGGMGIVLLAYDPQLQRAVALKVLRPDRADTQARERFVHEARAAARIVHDHVVPVYAVASPLEGPPFLVMQYVEGPTLRQRVQGAERLYPRQAAEIICQVAQGLAAVHAAGLLHRDLKPANVILDQASHRARITDFGLVRPVATPNGVTHENILPGTPEYMSPEQACEPNRIDVRSDVYGLGVTLYEALTGNVPFRGVPQMVLQQVLHDEPKPPRRLDDRVPRDLETICLKALAKEPARRYQTAEEFADDLRRWLRGEPIRARPVGVVGQVWRWCRRKPALAATLVLLAVTLLGGTASTTWLWLQVKGNLKLAKANLELGKKAVADCYTLVTEEPLLQQENMQKVRKLLLEKALPFFEGFQVQQRDDPDLEFELAKNQSIVAHITDEIEQPAKALTEFRKAVALLEHLARDHPEVTEYWTQLGTTCNNLGVVCMKMGLPEAGRDAFERARRIREQLVRDQPENLRYHRDLRAVLVNIGRWSAAVGQRTAAAEAFEQVWQLLNQLVQDHPEVAEYRSDFAVVCFDLGALHHQMEGPSASAQRFLEQAKAIQERLVQEYPKVSKYRVLLARNCSQLGRWYRDNRKITVALEVYERARRLWEQLVRDDPQVTEYQRSLARVCNDLGNLHQDAGTRTTAQELFQQALHVGEQLVQSHPDVPKYRLDLGVTCMTFALFHHSAGQNASAQQLLERARELQEPLVEQCPTVPDFQSALANTYHNLALVQQSAGQMEAAKRSYEQAGRLREQLIWAHPENSRYQSEQGRMYIALALLHEARGDLSGAERFFEQAREIQERLVQAYPKVPDYQSDLAVTYQNLGKFFFDAGQPQVGKTWYAQAVSRWNDLLCQPPNDLVANRWRLQRAIALAFLGDHVLATSEATALAEAPNHYSEPLCLLAMVWVTSLAEANGDSRLLPAERAEKAKQYADTAVQLLTKAHQAGYFKKPDHVNALLHDKALDPIRGRADLQMLLADIASELAAEAIGLAR